jgi:hypothetical protein
MAAMALYLWANPMGGQSWCWEELEGETNVHRLREANHKVTAVPGVVQTFVEALALLDLAIKLLEILAFTQIGITGPGESDLLSGRCRGWAEEQG